MGRLYRHSALLERGNAFERAIKLHASATFHGGAPSKTRDSHLRTARRRVTFCRRCLRRTRNSEKNVRSARRPSSQSWPPRRNLSSWQKYSVHGMTKIRIAVNRMSRRPPRAYPREMPSIGAVIVEVCFNLPLDLIDHAPSSVLSKVGCKPEGARFSPKWCDLPLK